MNLFENTAEQMFKMTLSFFDNPYRLVDITVPYGSNKDKARVVFLGKRNAMIESKILKCKKGNT